MYPYPPIEAPLQVCAGNPRYFAGPDHRALLLTGSHTWNNLVDMGPRGRVVPFDWDAYLSFLRDRGHNFIRLWAYDALGTWNPADEVLDLPWLRSGPGVAADGGPKLDLEALNPAYFDRLRARVGSARDAGIYVGVMLFDSWSNFYQTETPIEQHVFAATNNVNGIDVLRTRTQGVHGAWCALGDVDALAIQERYVRRVVESVNDLDNVLFEISNEAGPQSHAWQEHLTHLIRAVEARLSHQHPIGQTGGLGTSNRWLHQSSADYVAPGAGSIDGQADGYRTGHYAFGEGPFDPGDRPVFLDTDHLWGIGGDATWAWKSFVLGYNPLYMDKWDDQPAGFFVHPRWPDPADPTLRRELGAIREVSLAIDLTSTVVERRAASTGYCLSVPDRERVVVVPDGRPASVELSPGRWEIRSRDIPRGAWSEPKVRLIPDHGTWEVPPSTGGPAVLHIRRLDVAPEDPAAEGAG